MVGWFRTKKKTSAGATGSGSGSGSGTHVSDSHSRNEEEETLQEHVVVEEEEQEKEDDESGDDEDDDDDDDDRPRLDPCEHWFYEDDIKALISDAIQAHYTEYAPNFSHASESLREDWWNYFNARVKYKRRIEPLVKKTFFKHLKPRLRDIIYRATKPIKPGVFPDRPEYISGPLFEQLCARRKDEKFLAKSEQCQKNRGKNPTHTNGRRNTVQVMSDMYKEKKKATGKHIPSTAFHLFRWSKTRKPTSKGKEIASDTTEGENEEVFLTPRDKEIHEAYQSRAAELEKTAELYTPNQLYFDVVGGYNRKGRLYGVGSAAELYYSREKVGKNRNVYEAGPLSQAYEQNAALTKRLNEMEARQKELEERLNQDFGDLNSNCNNMFNPFNRQNDYDDPSTGGHSLGPFPQQFPIS